MASGSLSLDKALRAALFGKKSKIAIPVQLTAIPNGKKTYWYLKIHCSYSWNLYACKSLTPTIENPGTLERTTSRSEEFLISKLPGKLGSIWKPDLGLKDAKLLKLQSHVICFKICAQQKLEVASGFVEVSNLQNASAQSRRCKWHGRMLS
eukprot:SAG31_NODE_6219_length_2114_cov_4.018527_2_plen_151_part_00